MKHVARTIWAVNSTASGFCRAGSIRVHKQLGISEDFRSQSAKVAAPVPRMGVIHQSVRLDCLSDVFLIRNLSERQSSLSETVASMREFDASAAERFSYLQELGRRLMARPIAGRSDG